MRGRAVLAIAATIAGVVVAVPSAVRAAPPPNPTNGQINAAQSRKTALANQVGQLSGQIASMQAKLQQLRGEQELAEQKYAYALYQQQQAEQAEHQADQNFAKSQQAVAAARQMLIRYVQATYMSSSVGGTTEALLTASDPSQLLEQGTVQRYTASHQLDAIGTMSRAMVEQSNAQAAATLAKQRAVAATNAANQARVDAANAVSAARAQSAELQRALASSQTQLATAQETLATLNHERVVYNRYVAYQAYLARQRAIAEARRRAAEAAAARRAAEHRNHGGGSSSGGGSSFGSSPISPSGGSWSPRRGERAVNRALSELGVPYAWAGGNSGGPTYGVCDPSNGAPGDCNVYGFDCSGLVMYAWGPYISLPHYAAAQYVVAGSYHPGPGDLRPGDLVFWSYDGTVSGIHHVAIYIGNGQIVEAPYSGAYIRVASLYEYGSYFGATRPLT